MTAAGSSSSGPRGRALSSGASTLGGGALTAAGSTSGGPHHDALADLLGAGWVSSNAFLCVVVEGVPRSALHDAAVPGVPLTMFSLLRHENRASVVHYALTRTSNYADPIASKEDLEFHVGNRVFDARPLFSSGGGGSRTASNAALEAGQGPRAQLDRFFAPGQWTTATAYAPITYAPMPVLVFKRLPLVAAGPASGGEVVPAAPSEVTAFPTTGEELAALAPLYPAPDRIHQVPACTRFRLVLVAVGSVSCADPDRLVIKRIVLSGFPISVKGRTATVKHMFYSPTDVDYFKKLEVYTKHGRHGEQCDRPRVASAVCSASPQPPHPNVSHSLSPSPSRARTRAHPPCRQHRGVPRHARQDEGHVRPGHQAARHRLHAPLQAGVPAVGRVLQGRCRRPGRARCGGRVPARVRARGRRGSGVNFMTTTSRSPVELSFVTLPRCLPWRQLPPRT